MRKGPRWVWVGCGWVVFHIVRRGVRTWKGRKGARGQILYSRSCSKLRGHKGKSLYKLNERYNLALCFLLNGTGLRQSKCRYLSSQITSRESLIPPPDLQTIKLGKKSILFGQVHNLFPFLGRPAFQQFLREYRLHCEAAFKEYECFHLSFS